MKKVIYTVLTGNYDRLAQPEVVDSAWDYVCFTDKAGQDGVWKLREIPYASANPILRARYAKLHPHLLLPEYELSVFMDANLCITGEAFYEHISALENASMALLEHPSRDCVYEELRYCYLKDKLSTRAAWGLLRSYKQMAMPRHFGLYETNVVLRHHRDVAVVALDKQWWRLLEASRCTRDQLSLTPALHLEGLQPALLLGRGLNARNVPYIRYSNHPRTGKENVPGRLNWANLTYNLRLAWRKCNLLWLR